MIREAARLNREEGLRIPAARHKRRTTKADFECRLAGVAARIERTYKATRQRALRIGARSRVPGLQSGTKR